MALTRTRSALKDFAREAIHAGANDDVATQRIERGLDNALKALAKRREWSFHRDTYDIITIPSFSITSTISVGDASTTVSDSGNTIPSNAVGGFFEFNSERHWYEITERASAGSATIRQAYTNESSTNLAAVSAVVLYPLVDLPANFRKEECLFDTANPDNELAYVDYGSAWLAHAQRAGSGEPEAYGLIPKRNDPNISQIILYPAPDVKKRYTMTYFRQPGWFSTATPATSSWVKDLGAQSAGTYDAYYVDWPDNLMDVLEAAVMMCVAREIKPEAYSSYKAAFNAEVAEAAAFDKVNGTPRQLSRGNTLPRGLRGRFQ